MSASMKPISTRWTFLTSV